MTTTFYRSRSAVGVRHFFSVEALLCSPVASWCTRNDEYDILPQSLDGGCSSPFSVRHYSAVRSRLGARGRMTTTSYRSRSAVGVRHIFSAEALLCCPVASWCTRNDDNDIVPWTCGGGCSTFVSVEAYPNVRSRFFTRNDDNDILPQPLGGGCSSPFFRQGITLLSGRVLVHAER
ncbi:uncharacterized protein TNCV_2439711 [Trichonephila clavipes]|nr:uncharacterized protein TNCV_2439711 [Trichonephila clavipes]